MEGHEPPLNPREEGAFDVLVMGRACVDHLSLVERFPLEDSKVPLEQTILEGGGQGATSAACIARLGGRVCYPGMVGDDEAGRFCRKRLEDSGIDTRYLKTVPGGITPKAYVFITKGTACRTIVYERSQLPLPEIDDETAPLIRKARVLLIDPQATSAASKLLALGGLPPVVYDCERMREGIEDMMKLADYFIPSSEFFASALTRIPGADLVAKIRSLKDMVAGTLIVTHGREGAFYFREHGLRQVLPPRVEIVDTTGAGDNFHAAFALARSRGFDLGQAVRFSVSVATLSCRAYGGRNGVPDFDEAYRAIQSLEEREVS